VHGVPVTTVEPLDPPPSGRTSEVSARSGTRVGVGEEPESVESRQRLGSLVREHFAFVWRVLRRLGLSESDADDAAQQVFLSASRRLSDIGVGSERGFLFSTAVNIAAHAHRSQKRWQEMPDSEIDDRRDSVPGAEELIDRRRARELLDEILRAMPMELRLVFVLFEVEQLTMAEIARMIDMPPGTVASRLRRAREDFAARVKRVEAKLGFPGGKL
jgi:RNA polymerase sigma-70 factor (ECF subfamily)